MRIVVIGATGTIGETVAGSAAGALVNAGLEGSCEPPPWSCRAACA